MDIAAAADSIARAMQADANVSAVFGTPLKLDTQTIIPVAAVVAAAGGGAGESPFGGGAGGGLDLRAVPLGFIHEEGGTVRFTAIELPALTEKEAVHEAGHRQRRALDALRARIRELTGRSQHAAAR